MKAKSKVTKAELALLLAAAGFLLALFLLRASDGRGASVTPQRNLPPETAPEKIDHNRADAEELQTLPGIGEELAERIVCRRAENGAFESVEEIRSVDGIGEKKYEAIRELITVNGGETP